MRHGADRSRARIHVYLACISAVTLTACASAPPPVVTPTLVRYEQKTAWILQLEDQRILRLPPPPPPAEPPVQPGRRRSKPLPPPPPPSSSPDLAVLVTDQEPRIRRRAALAIGRVGLREGIAALTPTLGDADPEVRAMAAFAIGLIGDSSAEPQLTPLLTDPAPLVRGRASEALGLIGAKGAEAAIGRVAAEYARSPQVAAMKPDDEPWPGAPEADAFKLAVFALVRLGAYEPLAAAVLDAGRPVTTWWPVAYALQRVGDPRAAPALMQLLEVQGRYTRAFAARGLGSLKHTAAIDRLLPLVGPGGAPLEVVVAAIRALAQCGATAAAAPLATLASQSSNHPNVRLEAVTALGTLKAPDGLPVVQDLLLDEWPAMRAAALRSAAAIDPESFALVLAGMEPDRDWRVRAALADVLSTQPPDVGLEHTRAMLQDGDKRVIGAVLDSLRALKAPDLASLVLDRLKDPDFVVRAAAARGIEALKPAGGADALREALKAAEPDSAYGARAAILSALAAYGPAEALDSVKAALADKDWAVRVRAVELLRSLDPSAHGTESMRPAPGPPITPYDDPQLIAPEFSPHAFIETAKGTIEVELAVLDAPQTTRNFMALVRKGFFNGLQIHRVVPNFVVQDGDPRGDGEGGPGHTIRDELNDRPYVRGTVGMALEWRDTGGSQFFITHSPQPHLDARYTVFGHVVNGMEVVDRIQQGDTIQRVRVWDGKGWQ
jgi:cyclophilin family peptidyl-prolyl cis-trans isomerase/HEAT repeat protein